MIAFLLGAVAFASAANSVTVSLSYGSTDSNTLTINDGDSFNVLVSADSVSESSMDVSLNLVRPDGIVVEIWSKTTSDDSYSRELTIQNYAYSGVVGSYTLKATVTGSSGATDSAELTLNINGEDETNYALVITSTPILEVNEGVVYSYQVTATGADNDVLNYFLFNRSVNPETDAAWVSINSQTGLITGTAPFVGADKGFTVEVGVLDGKGGVANQIYTLNVRNVPAGSTNSAPVITSTPILEVNEGAVYSYQVTATDANAEDVLTYSLVGANWLSMNSNGLVTGIAPLQVGRDQGYLAYVTVSDGNKNSVQRIDLVVKDVPVSEEPTSVVPSVGGCLLDYNKDGIVDIEDFNLFTEGYKPGGEITSENAKYDLNDDGFIDFKDFILFAGNYGKGKTCSANTDTKKSTSGNGVKTLFSDGFYDQLYEDRFNTIHLDDEELQSDSVVKSNALRNLILILAIIVFILFVFVIVYLFRGI